MLLPDDTTIQNLDIKENEDIFRDAEPGKVRLDKRESTASTRFQIQRQHTSVLTDEDHKEEEETEHNVLQDIESYEEKVEKILLDLNVPATSLRTKDNGHILVTFCLENSSVENALLRLQESGIGNSPSDTSISVIPASVHFEIPLQDDQTFR